MSRAQTQIKKILVKKHSDRRSRELNMLSDHFKHTRFFKELKMKPNQLNEVVRQLDLKSLAA